MAEKTRTRPRAVPAGISSGDYLLLAAGLLLAVVLRWQLLRFESGDFTTFTSGWYEFIRQNGGIEALRSGLSNYTPPYIYGMILVHALLPQLAPVVALKLVSLPFDFVCASYVARIVGLRYATPALPLLAGLIVLFAPTVVLNGSFWGQVDVVSAAGVVACVFYLMSDRQQAALIALGLALAFKLQAIFVAPLIAVLLLRGQLDWRRLWIVPAIYVGAIIPAWLCGRSLWSLLTIYAGQAGYYERLTSNAPHVYQWLPSDMYQWFYPAGMIWAAAVVMIFTVAASRVPGQLGRERLLLLATISVLVVPYFLPKMHERYFFIADVLTIPLAFYFPRYAPVAVAMTAVSLFSYGPFLLRTSVISLPIVALAPGIMIGVLLYRFASRE